MNRRTLTFLFVVVAIFAVAATAAIPLTNHPDFCASCHTIRPSVESWRISSHKDVTCVDCHVRPGLHGFIEDKFLAGLGDVAITWFGTPTEPHNLEAHVTSEVCISCHRAILRLSEKSPRDLPSPVKDIGLIMDHRKHMDAFKERGRGEGCTTCHSRVVHGKPVKGYRIVIPRGHIKVDLKPHYPDHPEGSVLWESALADCVRCHDGNSTHAGKVLSKECETCHLPDRIGDFLF